MAKTITTLTDIKVLTDSQYNSESKKNSILYATPIDVFYNSRITGESGYARASNGLIIQWGKVHVQHETESTITFPIPFTLNNSYSMSGMVHRSDSSNPGHTDDMSVSFTEKLASYSKVFAYDAGDNNYSTDYYWVAIGC